MNLLDIIIEIFALLFPMVILFGSLASIFTFNHSPTIDDLMSWDFTGCEQMRESGWSEEEIKKFMGDCNGYYDKDYEYT